jgi:D-alanyl-D-alanine carboxypeptidase
VLPVALAVVAASTSEAVAAAASATAAWQGREAQPEADAQPAEVDPRAVAPAEVVVSAPDAVVVDDPVGQPLESTNPHLRRRLFVAGLTSIA